MTPEPSGLSPELETAIRILEEIEVRLEDEGIFDCKDGDTRWFDFEDMVVSILEEAKHAP